MLAQSSTAQQGHDSGTGRSLVLPDERAIPILCPARGHARLLRFVRDDCPGGNHGGIILDFGTGDVELVNGLLTLAHNRNRNDDCHGCINLSMGHG